MLNKNWKWTGFNAGNILSVKNEKGIFKGFPKKGDYVEIQEIGRTVRILSIVDKNLLSNGNTETDDLYSSFSNFGGYIGI